jgi:hypothetical protein
MTDIEGLTVWCKGEFNIYNDEYDNAKCMVEQITALLWGWA